MNRSTKLQFIAVEQGGLFTAKQAISCGYVSSNHCNHVANNNWVKERFRGLYSLPAIIQDENSSLWALFLWTRGRDDIPQGVISHESALLFYELSEVNPQKVYFTVPASFRKSTATPSHLVLHKTNLPASDIVDEGGLKVTTALRTLIDVAKEQNISLDIIESAIRDALSKGYVTKKEINENKILKRFVS